MSEMQDAKMFFSIKEVASLLDESEPTLRYWEKEFQYVITPKRNKYGARFYTESDIDDVRLIKYLIRDCGLTLDGVRKRLKNNKDGAVKQAKVVQYLRSIRAEIKALGEALYEAENLTIVN